MNAYVIEVAIAQDIPAIRSVQNTTWRATYPNVPYGDEDVEDVYANMSIRSWVARDSHGMVIGYCIAQKEQTQNRIKALFVLPAYQKIGIGRMLMHSAKIWLGTKKTICINVAEHNTNAIGFYTRLGWKKTHRSVSDETCVASSDTIIPEIEMVYSSIDI